MNLFNRNKQSIQYKGKHYTEYVETLNTLKRSGKDEQAIRLTVELLPAVGDDVAVHDVVALWYYERLAILYRTNKDYAAEVKILVRYLRVQKGKLTKHRALVARLGKARELEGSA